MLKVCGNGGARNADDFFSSNDAVMCRRFLGRPTNCKLKIREGVVVLNDCIKVRPSGFPCQILILVILDSSSVYQLKKDHEAFKAMTALRRSLPFPIGPQLFEEAVSAEVGTKKFIRFHSGLLKSATMVPV